MIHEVLSGNAVIHQRILGSKSEIEGNTCYCVKSLKEGNNFISTHEDFVVREFEFDLEQKTMTE